MRLKVQIGKDSEARMLTVEKMSRFNKISHEKQRRNTSKLSL